MIQVPPSRLTIEAATAPNAADLAALVEGLNAWNAARAPLMQWNRVTFFLRAPNGEIAGGLDGHTSWGWLFVRILWVATPHQRQGFGRKLMARAEAEARSRGCRNAYLDTFDFQALGFYERLGYRQFGKLPEFPPGHTRYFLEKRGL
jgi:GNAT superfamily N-acetyltransferase